MVVRDEGETLVFTGRKSFSTGSKVSDVTVLEGVLEGHRDHVFAIVPSDQPGSRSTTTGTTSGSGSPRAAASPSTACGHRGPRPPGTSTSRFGRVSTTPSTCRPSSWSSPTSTSVSRRAPWRGGRLHPTKARSWLHGGHERAADEPYVIDIYGDLTGKLWAAEALADRVAEEALHDDPDAVTEQDRGEFEVRVAAVKARATEVALEVTSGSSR